MQINRTEQEDEFNYFFKNFKFGDNIEYKTMPSRVAEKPKYNIVKFLAF